MFIMGISNYAALVFSLLTMMVAVPSAIKIFNWAFTLQKGSVTFETPMLYAFGFMGLFTIGGMTGVFLGALGMDIHLTETYFIVAHFHFVMVGGMLMAFLSGVTGQFYKQFAVTIAISTIISAINSLTLSPALAAKLLRPHGAPPDRLSRVIERLFGWVFHPFNRFFKRNSARYQNGVSRSLAHRGRVFAVYAVLLIATGAIFSAVPRGFIPIQDKLYLIAGVKLPEGSSIERTDAALKKVAAAMIS